MPRKHEATALVAVLLLAAAAAWLVTRFGPPPSADTGHGTEAAFARGLFERELAPKRGPQRWSQPSATFTFLRLAPGSLGLELRVRGQQTPLHVILNGVERGVIEPGRFVGRYTIDEGPRAGELIVELQTTGFEGADGPRGALVDRVRVSPAPDQLSFAVLLLWIGPALVVVLAALRAGCSPLAAALAGSVSLALEGVLLWPDGLVHSPYATTLGLALSLAAVVAAGFSEWVRRRAPTAGAWAFAALFGAALVHAVAATTPTMVASDVVFHANRLRDVAAGDLFPTSVTQHAVPFHIPYGVSFYAVLAPLAWSGLDRVELVRAGAGLAWVIVAAALFLFTLRLGARTAGLATLLLQMLPGSFDIHSFGNLSNAFGQAAGALFFCWWASGAVGGWALGAVLVVLAGLGHLSSLIVLSVLASALAFARYRAGTLDRTRIIALAVGAVLCALYYLHFTGLIAEQLPRLLEGGGQGRGASQGTWDALLAQGRGVLVQWGLPALLLALASQMRTADANLDRELRIYVVAVSLLVLPATFSPLEVRYLYALGLPIAIFAAAGFERLLKTRWRAVAFALLLAQAVLFGRNLLDAILFRYRV